MQLRDFAPPPRSPVPPDLLDDAGTLIGALATLVERFPDFECLTVLDRHRDEQRISFGRLWARARQIQSALLARRLPRGGFVLLVLPTGPELISAYFGVMLAGGVPSLIATPSNRVADRRVYAAHVGRILDNAAAEVLYCDDEVAELYTGADASLLGRTKLLTPRDVSGAAGNGADLTPEPEDIATVQYSSGSTGTPKGILLTHRAILNNLRTVRHGLALTPDDVSVNWVPLYHDMGLMDAFLLPLLGGCPTVLIPTMDFMREPALWLWAIHHYRGALSWAPNFAYTLCAKRIPDDELHGLDLSSWRIALSAAEPVLAHTIDAFAARFAAHGFRPQAMTPGWGLAENVTLATAHPVDAAPVVETVDRGVLGAEDVARPVADEGVSSVAIGRCLARCELEIRDAEGRRLQDRRVGTIWLRSDSLFSGYHRNPELTARVLVDGWVNTGDRGYSVGPDLYFVAREKDLIVVGGQKYLPHDVETAINRVPGVREGCAVAFGVMNAERGTEDVVAVVETRETDAAALARLRDAIREEVTRTTGLGLRHVLLVPPGGVEKTTSGKLARRATQERYAGRVG